MRDLKLKLSALWAARMVSGLQGDSTRLHDPVALRDLLEGTSDVQVTDELLLIMSLIFAIPILMIVLSLMLPDRVNRRANRSLGVAFFAFDLVFLGLSLFLWEFSAYEVFWALMYAVFTGLVAWYAWRWPAEEVQGASGAP